MTDVITGSHADALASFEADRQKWGGKAWCYNYPGNWLYMGLLGYYWCALQVCRNLKAAGLDLTKSISQWAYCPAILNEFWESTDWHTIAPNQVDAGDVGFMLDHNGVAYHIMFGAAPAANGILHTAEGDTSDPSVPGNGSQTIGGCITYKARVAANYRMHWFRHAYLGTAKVPAAAAAMAASVLTLGSSGVRVAHLQAALNKVFPTFVPKGGLATDGQYGPLTAAAVTAFQKSAKIAADGVCGPDTLAALAKYGVTNI